MISLTEIEQIIYHQEPLDLSAAAAEYFVYLNNKDNDSIVKQSFLMSKNLHSMNNSGCYSNFKNMFEQYKIDLLAHLTIK